MTKLSIVLAVLALGCVIGCSVPSHRKMVTLPGPAGRPVTCFEPPPDVMAGGGIAKVDANIPKVIEALKVDAETTVTYQRIRAEVPNLQATETVEFRLCAMYANGIVTPEQYQRFLTVLPLLRRGAPAAPVGATGGATPSPAKESVRTKIGSNFAVSADGCKDTARTFTVTATGRLDTSRGGQGGAPMGFDFVITGNNSHGVRDASATGNSVTFTLHAEGRGTNQGVFGCVGAEGANAAADVYAWVQPQ